MSATDSAQQLAAHLLDSAEHVLDPCERLGNTLVASLLALGQQLVALALPLNLVSETVLLEPGFTLLRRIASIDIDITTRVARVKDVVKVLAVVRGGDIGLNPADDLVLLVDTDRQLVAEATLAVLLRPGRVGVLLAPLRRLSVGGHRALPLFGFVCA